jgi:tetratricopeptide (TPR) repeat protein
MTKWVGVKIQYKKVMLLCSMFFLFTVLCIPVWSETEVPLNLPQVEGSKSFDLEVSQINREAIKNYQMGLFSKAVTQFKKAVNLSRQLRDPSQGILHFNLSLSFHKEGNHEEATKHFYSARRFARGNPKILESELLKMHECGFNPSISCDKKIPLPMNIEGSH